jgi:hypothetical protein
MTGAPRERSRLSTCASTLNELADQASGTTAGRQDPGPQRRGRQQEITLDRRGRRRHRGRRVPGRHLRTDRVVLVAESMGPRPRGPWCSAGPTERWIWGLEREHGLGVQGHLPTPNLDRRLRFPGVALGLTAATRRMGWWVLSLLADLAEGLLLLCLESKRTV